MRWGVDEVGRGPLAGPVVAAAVALPERLDGLADSKSLGKARREELAILLHARAYVALGAASSKEIERHNILGATLLAMRRAAVRLHRSLNAAPDEIVVDGKHAPAWPEGWNCRTLCMVKADANVPEVAAASIVAKVARDRLMARLDALYPGYGWARNAGYPTAQHLSGLDDRGVTPHHRRTFAPVAARLKQG